MGRAERKVEREYLDEVKHVRGKFRLAYHMADAALTHPTGIVKDIIYPAAGGEATLQALVEEYRSSGVFEERVQTTMRASYGRYYRRMIPTLLRVLTFQSNNAVHRPVIEALALLTRYADSDQIFYAEMDTVPLIIVVVHPRGGNLFSSQPKRGAPRINRISYELCVLNALRDKVRCKEIWVEGAKNMATRMMICPRILLRSVTPTMQPSIGPRMPRPLLPNSNRI